MEESVEFGHGYCGTRSIVIPYWFLNLLAATCAAVPWIGGMKLFNLRTLFIKMVLAALLGAAVLAIK